jgi:hypothetical protein
MPVVRSVQACCGQLGGPAARLLRRGSLALDGGRGEPGTEASCAPNAGPLRKAVEESRGGGVARSGRADDAPRSSRGYRSADTGTTVTTTREAWVELRGAECADRFKWKVQVSRQQGAGAGRYQP